MKPLNLYALFHLNLAYSSIEEDQRPAVLRQCYWPLLRLVEKQGIPIGIEATGYTLETIAALDQAWLAALRRLTDQGLCDFIGSGYAQIIGPLVPAEVNAANLRLGHAVYERLLGRKPEIALVNEQAYAPGLIRHYLNAGYRAIVMEWDNPFQAHPEWEARWRYLPQIACGPDGAEIPLLWSHSIAFQKFQRYAHHELELDEFLAYLGRHVGGTPRAFPLYANDAEIFDFRPGRYETEAELKPGTEWHRLESLFRRLGADGRFAFRRPGQVLDFLDLPGAGQRLHLESPEHPIPVKKQGKYNISRWAVTGPDDLQTNSACWRIYRSLVSGARNDDASWRELCYLWSSDFRTHITRSRWKKYCRELDAAQKRHGASGGKTLAAVRSVRRGFSRPRIRREGRYLTVETRRLKVRLNCQRGLAIDGVWLDSFAGPPWLGTLPHGYYDAIDLSADWYSGLVVMESPGRPKVTDLNPVVPSVEVLLASGEVLVRAAVPTNLGRVEKTIRISLAAPTLSLEQRLCWPQIPLGSLRLGHITLHPESFDRASLWYETKNGGDCSERIALCGERVDHGEPASFLVSSRQGFGMTDGRVAIGDAKHRLSVEVDKGASSLLGLLSYREAGGGYFARIAFSAREMDESRVLRYGKGKDLVCRFLLTLD